MSGRSAHRNRGFVTVWVIVSLAALLMFAGLMLDTSHAYTVGQELQSAADAASLAAISSLSTSFSAAQTAAINAAANNNAAGASVQLANSDVVEGNYNSSTGAFTANTTPYNAIQITARRTSSAPGGAVNLFFGQLFGISTVNITRKSVAFTGGGGQEKAGFIVLDPSSSGSLALSGAGVIKVGGSGGDIYVNSNNVKAVTLAGSSSLTATDLDIVGSDYLTGAPTLNAALSTGVTALADPLSSMSAPTKNADLGSIALSHVATQTVGTGDQTAVYYYSGGISVIGSAQLTLNAGIYILGPPGLSISNSGVLNATNCVFYLTGSGSSYGVASFAGAATVNITPPNSGTYSGVAIFQDRTTPSSSTMTVANSASVNLTGTIYLPSSQISYSGAAATFGSQIIANDITVGNSGSLTVSYDGRNPVTTGSSTVSLGD